MSSEEKAVDQRSLWSKHYSGTGQAYYYNLQSGQSQWDKPECFQDEDSEQAVDWQQYLTEDGKPYWYNTTTRESRWQNPQVEEEYSSDGEEEIPPNPHTQFIDLLRDNTIASNMKWDQVVKQLQIDARWKCIGSISEKKRIFNRFLEDFKKQEKEENKSKLNMAKEDFMKMLEEHKINSSDIKLWKVQSYLINDPRWKSILEEKEREILFQDFLDKLYEVERDQMRVTRKTSTEEFRKRLERYIEVGVLSHQSTWEQCLKLFSQDRLLQIMVPVDALGVFEEVINPLYEQWKQSIISKYRLNRIKFRELLQEQLSEGVLTHKSKWQQFVQTIQQDDRFVNMLGQPGSQPHELYQDFIQHLKQNHQLYKSELKMHLQQKGVKTLLGVQFEEVDALFNDNQIWLKMPIYEQKYYYRYFQENIKQTSTSQQSKRYKKQCKRYFKMLKSLPEIKPYDELLPLINQKVSENPKLNGLLEEQKKSLYDQFIQAQVSKLDAGENNNQNNESEKKKKKKKDKKDKDKKEKKDKNTDKEKEKEKELQKELQKEKELLREKELLKELQKEKDLLREKEIQKEKELQKEKEQQQKEQQKERESRKQDLGQFEPEIEKQSKLEHEPEDGEIPQVEPVEVEKSKSKKKHKSHHKSKKHHK